MIWKTVHTPVGKQAIERTAESEGEAKKLLEESAGQALEFVRCVSKSVSYRMVATPDAGGSCQYWCQ